MIRCGLDINENRDRIDTALGAIERGIRRVGDSVGENLAAIRAVLKKAVA